MLQIYNMKTGMSIYDDIFWDYIPAIKT